MTLHRDLNIFCLQMLMLLHLLLCIFNTIELYSVFVNNYLVDHSKYTYLSDRHTCLIQPLLGKTTTLLENTKETIHL